LKPVSTQSFLPRALEGEVGVHYQTRGVVLLLKFSQPGNNMSGERVEFGACGKLLI
jgi:hypothetical protein